MTKCHITKIMYKRAIKLQKQYSDKGVRKALFDCAAEIWAMENRFVPDMESIKKDIEFYSMRKKGGGWLGF